MLSKTPTPNSDQSRLLPPDEINGSGTPVSGNTEIIEPTLINAWQSNHSEIPVASSRENMSGAAAATRKPRSPIVINSAKIISAPIQPNSSAMIAKIESLAASGR